ncbi:hypothetical protein [Glycomyces harbinensis]|uniref:DUF4178 domain-containing protein n=1 Tax=Glycomyces harbinensis TaxID=58114 RepID=A0A1G7A9U2_9ACTN|nr:hypothetical protein [Glycomyces harbinensis]SDE11664.1 hypothetical protein SAMN05216270_11324 [Glycomyces harbinensis]
MSGGQGPSNGDRFAVVSRRVVFVAGSALMIGGILAILSGRVALGITLLVVTLIAAMLRGLYTVQRGRRALAEHERAQAPAGSARGPGAPAPVDQVVAALTGMNGDGLPYRIDAARTPDGVRVDVQWKQQELRWQTLFVRGSRAYAWRMEVDLDPSAGTYKFIEHSGQASVKAAAGPTGATAYGNWTWQKGKTSHGTSASFVEGADGQVTVTGPAGPRTSWEGAVMIKPGDAKVPVFTVLRDHGWRPRLDWFGARMFEK